MGRIGCRDRPRGRHRAARPHRLGRGDRRRSEDRRADATSAPVLASPSVHSSATTRPSPTASASPPTAADCAWPPDPESPASARHHGECTAFVLCHVVRSAATRALGAGANGCHPRRLGSQGDQTRRDRHPLPRRGRDRDLVVRSAGCCHRCPADCRSPDLAVGAWDPHRCVRDDRRERARRRHAPRPRRGTERGGHRHGVDPGAPHRAGHARDLNPPSTAGARRRPRA